MAITDKHGLPTSITVESASPHETKLIQETLNNILTKNKPKKLIGDGAFDCDPLDVELKKQGIELIAPHRKNRIKPKTQDGRKLRRYRRRWKIERLFAWLHNFRRIVVRWEYKPENYLAFVHLGCIVILLRNLVHF